MGQFTKSEVEEPLSLEPSEGLSKRIDSLERAFSTELTGSMSLNVRGAFLAGASAVSLLLVAQFSATWLDDGHWEFRPDVFDIVMQALLVGTAVAFALSVLVSVWAVWPRRGFASALRQRIQKMNAGDAAGEATLLLEMLDNLRVANERKGRVIRLASVPFVVAVLGTVGQSLVFAFRAELVDPARTDKPATVDLSEASGLPSRANQLLLASTYAPRVWLHHAEEFGPLDPSAFIRGSELQWRHRRSNERVAARGSVAAERLGRACETASGGCYEFGGIFARELTRPFSKGPRPAKLKPRRGYALNLDNGLHRGQAGRDPDVPVYYEFRRTRKELLLTYWFAYGHSSPHTGGAASAVLGDELSHEGDWENVDVALTLDASAPLGAYFYGHGAPTRRPWDQLELDGDHPVVYSALDSHASYAEGGTTKVCGDLGSADDIRDQGFQWDTWRGKDSLRPARAEPWYGYGGAWGAADKAEGRTGPLGPSEWKLPAQLEADELAPAACH
ncbi:MAG: hypothetical protein QOE60_1432 [Thermoleophilaceae bacterium]|jgi:hypothetical protein|nr:hypothetical protein [Thermoleophilaceae bacterium]